MKNILLLNLLIVFLLQKPCFAQTGCDPVWEQLLMHSCLAFGGMEVADYDNDGKQEMIMASNEYFFVMEYFPEKNDYDVSWMSKHYDWAWEGDGPVTALKILDADNDGQQEVLIGTGKGKLDVYDLNSLELEVSLDAYLNGYELWTILKDDGDNDGQEELMVSSNNSLVLFNIVDGKLEFQQSIEGYMRRFGCADTDGDGIKSLIFSNGELITIENSVVSPIYEYCTTCDGGFVETLDVDNDSKEEVIIAGDNIQVIDADTKERKWVQEATSYANALRLADANGDGLPDILIGDSQWGHLHCFNAMDGAPLWTIENPDWGIDNVVITDCDSDNELEIAWASSCYHENHLYVHNLNQLELEWTSEYIIGPFSGVQSGDVDGDSQPEIVSLSRNGILFVFDHATHNLEWKTSAGYFPWEWSYGAALKVADIDLDGLEEIIMAGGKDYDPIIAVINGSTHQIESQHIWPVNSGMNSFVTIDIADADNNGIPEYICGDLEYFYCINSNDYSTLWRSPYIFQLSDCVAADIDDDFNVEIITAGEKLQVFDAVTHQIQYEQDALTDDRFTALCYLDEDGNGKHEIAGGTANGKLFILDGLTEEITWIDPEVHEWINAIRAGNFNSSEGTEFVFTTYNYINFYNSDNLLIQNKADFDMEWTGALDVSDIDNDGEIEILVGTVPKVIEYSADCFGCSTFNVEAQVTDPTCRNTNGSIALQVFSGQPPYTYLWNTGHDEETIDNLPAGIYSVLVSDSENCSFTYEFTLQEQVFKIDSLVSSPDSTNTLQCEGQLHVYLSGGTAPYRYISGNDTVLLTDNLITGLCAGYHGIWFIDSKNCEDYSGYLIEEVMSFPEWKIGSDLIVYPVPTINTLHLQFNCKVKGDAFAEVRNMQGILMKRFKLGRVRSELDLSGLAEGIYFMKVADGEKQAVVKIVIAREK